METEAEVTEDGDVVIGDLYTLNKEAYKSVFPYNRDELNENLNYVYEWLKENKTLYTMLLCHERRDYTILRHQCETDKVTYKAIFTDLLECLQNRGKILDIRYIQDSDAWEIWLRINKENFIYMFFDAEGFIVEV